MNRVNETPSTARTRADLLAPRTWKCLARSRAISSGCAGPPTVARTSALTMVAHSRTSMAERMPSLTRLKQIEVTKIAAPGNAQDSGAT